jgi:predicted ATPase
VAPAIGRALGLRLAARDAVDDLLVEEAARRLHAPTLLLLDNFEHLLPVALLLVRLLDAAEPLSLLVTSRSVLRVTGECEFELLPLPVPDQSNGNAPRRLSENPSVSLFLQRATAARHGFELSADNAGAVAEICRRVDGLPLALELAAARVGMLSPAALLDRLRKPLDLLTLGARDLPARQQTLRNTIEWSHQLLSEAERRLFRRLAVFAGGATLDGVDAVCNGRSDLQVDVLNGMTSLVDKHLVQTVAVRDGEPRFRMLETIREFALEQLAHHRERVDIRQLHAAYCLILAGEHAALSTPDDRRRWLERCELEHENLLAALDFVVTHHDAEMAQRLGAALHHFWVEREFVADSGRSPRRILSLT